MTTNCQQFLQHCLLFDIEVNEKNVIYSIGAAFRGERFLIEPGQTIAEKQLKALDDFGSAAAYTLGHNILHHDLPRLRERAPGLKLYQKPAIDTLYLSPLAFPQNPYHRLVKNYQLVRDSVNNPVADALLAGRVFSEQWDAFKGHLSADSHGPPSMYRSFLQRDPALKGTADALGAMDIALLEEEALWGAFLDLAQKHTCQKAVWDVLHQLRKGMLSHPSFAYVAAWLTVAGGNSVLPPWVRHHFPEVPAILHQLRESPCSEDSCQYCATHHNPKNFLKEYFGFSDFRETPATEDGKSLQAEIVTAAARETPLFATLPTGGGKSLCYLLPALMRYLRRNMLTLVISPLQALMKDQVDNFSKQTGTRVAAALYGMLTMPERGEVQEGVRLGDIGILFISPEQLRNQSFVKIISQREIGAWVFDEAHCLSKWGHDFRPDYLYSIRFIREFAERQKMKIPPVQCFTATAKKDVKAEIIDIIQSELGLRVRQFAGGHERANLFYEVWQVDSYEKNNTILELLRARYRSNGSVVIYCLSRRNTEKLAEFLQNQGYVVEAFHAGLEPSRKKRIQEDFINGLTPIICATNAFGMGIDKDDVRLVIHADIPGSLENYLQEAGRAGRDRQNAECILIFNDQDIEGQFRLSSHSRLTKREIAQLLRGIRYAAKGENSVVLTSGELLRTDVVDIDPDEHPDADTRVRTAVSWLERTGYLERNENNTRVFQGKPLVMDMQEAVQKISALNLSERQQKRWLAILSALMERRTSHGFSADELAVLSAFEVKEDEVQYESETERVIRTLHDMAQEGLLSKETTMSAYIRYKVPKSAVKHLTRICSLETEFLQCLQEEAPEADVEQPLVLDLRQVNQRLVDKGFEDSTPHSLKLILHGLSRDGKGLAGQKGSIGIKARGNNRFTVVMHRDWPTLINTVKIRQRAAHVALQTMHDSIAPSTQPNASLLVEFTLEEIVEGLRRDLVLLPQLRDPLAAAERAITFMHEQNIIALQQGLAVFRQAMTLSLRPEAKGRRYSQSDFLPLQTHYQERNFQIHVMNEYARIALEKLSAARNLIASYFNDEKRDFIQRFFPGKEKHLQRATSEQSYLKIVDELKNTSQERIVAAETERNMLVLAGPGSGKTRVVAHRAAFLLRVKRVRAQAILILCFNRSAVMSLRRRLRDLVGSDMNGISTLTFHGLALRLTGRSLVSSQKGACVEETDFSEILKDAIRFLKGEADVLGFGDASPRDALIGRFSHILVDEYQDIDAEQYELVSLLAGKSEEESDRKMTILAVGDDDQNIYRFRGANVEFIRRFHHEYKAEIHYLVENYRSCANIIAAANAVISENSDRMKKEHPIKINAARKRLPPGGNWQVTDRVGKGKVQILQVRERYEQAFVLLEELDRLKKLDGAFRFENCAILARQWSELNAVRSLFEQEQIPVSLGWGRNAFPSLARIKEGAELLDYLRENSSRMISAEDLMDLLPVEPDERSIWHKNLHNLILEWREETANTPQSVLVIEEYFYDALAEQHRNKMVQNGVFLSTVHAVKGLEFDHVFVLGGGWRHVARQEMEEERRLYYVAISRARETLHLFSLEESIHPHLSPLFGDYFITRKNSPRETQSIIPYCYELLGMKEIFLDYGGLWREDHPVRKALSELTTGDRLTPEPGDGIVHFLNQKGIAVARMSKSAGNIWKDRLAEIEEVRIVAIVRRYKKDIHDQEFSRRCYGDSWNVPIVEMKIQPVH